ncbi:unnamed protein product [Diamesa serratosioi]
MSSKAGIVHQAHIQETQYSYFSKKPAYSKSLIRSMNWTIEALSNNHENTKLSSNVKLVEAHATVDRCFESCHPRSFLPKLYAKVIMGHSDSSDDGTSRYSSNSRRSSLTGKEKKRGGPKNDSWSKAIPPHTAQIPPNSYEATTNSSNTKSQSGTKKVPIKLTITTTTTTASTKK